MNLFGVYFRFIRILIKHCIGEMYSLRNWGRYAHLSQNILYVDQEGGHVAGLQVPDVPDSEARGISHFPRVDDLV